MYRLRTQKLRRLEAYRKLLETVRSDKRSSGQADRNDPGFSRSHIGGVCLGSVSAYNRHRLGRIPDHGCGSRPLFSVRCPLFFILCFAWLAMRHFMAGEKDEEPNMFSKEDVGHNEENGVKITKHIPGS